MDEIEQVKRFIEHLKIIGYPSNSIIQEFAIGSQFADIAIIDTESKQPIMIFELKSSGEEKVKEIAENILGKFKRALSPLEIQTYLIFGIPGENDFSIWNYINKKIEGGGTITGIEKLKEIPPYLSSLLTTRSKSIQNVKEARQITVDYVKYIFAGFLG